MVGRMQRKQLSTLSCRVLVSKWLTVTLAGPAAVKHTPGPLPTGDPPQCELAVSNSNPPQIPRERAVLVVL